MSKNGDIQFEDNSREVKAQLRQTAERGMLKVAQVVEGNIKPLVPVDFGNLRNSITHTIDSGAEIVAKIGTGLSYGPYVEKGTGEFAENGMGRKGGWSYKAPNGKWYKTKGQSPQPFLRPGFKHSASQIKKILGDEFGATFKG